MGAVLQQDLERNFSISYVSGHSCACFIEMITYMNRFAVFKRRAKYLQNKKLDLFTSKMAMEDSFSLETGLAVSLLEKWPSESMIDDCDSGFVNSF